MSSIKKDLLNFHDSMRDMEIQVIFAKNVCGLILDVSWSLGEKIFNDNVCISQYFSQDEWVEYNGLLGGKRKREFLISRICLKILARRMLGVDYREILSRWRFLKTNNPYPSIWDGNKKLSDIHVSVSHRKSMIFVVLSKYFVGVDVEVLSSSAKAIQRYVRVSELKILQSFFTHGFCAEEMFVGLWCSMESIGKAFGIGVRKARQRFLLSKVFELQRDFSLVHEYCLDFVFLDLQKDCVDVVCHVFRNKDSMFGLCYL